VILAGGVGSRFWPASTPARPKQLLPLASERPLIRDTVDRIVPLVPPERLRILTGEARAFAHWTPVHVHLGAAEATGRVALLEGPSLGAGKSGLAQLVLDRPIGALWGDGFVIRDQSAQRTIGGGRVIDVTPPARGRAKPERLAYLRHMEGSDNRASLAALLEVSPRGLNLARFAANRNLTKVEAEALFANVPLTTVGALGFSAAHWDALKSSALDALAAWHARAPDAVGPAEDRVLAGVPREVSTAIVTALMRGNQVVKEGTGVRLASHKASLAPADATLWAQVTPQLDQAALRPPSLHEIATAIGNHGQRKQPVAANDVS